MCVYEDNSFYRETRELPSTIVKRYCANLSETEKEFVTHELEEALITLSTSNKYDPEKASEKSFASLHLKQKCQRISEKLKRKQTLHSQYENEQLSHGMVESDPSKELEKENVENVVARVFDCGEFEKDEIEIIKGLYWNDLSFSELAENIKVGEEELRHQADNILARFKQTLLVFVN